MDKLVDQAVEFVFDQCRPMTKHTQIDFLEDVIARLEGMSEALRDEIEHDQQSSVR